MSMRRNLEESMCCSHTYIELRYDILCYMLVLFYTLVHNGGDFFGDLSSDCSFVFAGMMMHC